MKSQNFFNNSACSSSRTIAASSETVRSVREMIEGIQDRYARMGFYEIPAGLKFGLTNTGFRKNTCQLLLDGIGIECLLGEWRSVKSRATDNFLTENVSGADATTLLIESLVVARLDLYSRVCYSIGVDFLVEQQNSGTISTVVQSFLALVNQEYLNGFRDVLTRFFAANGVHNTSTTLDHDKNVSGGEY